MADGAGTCIGGDVRREAGVGPAVGYLKMSAATGTVAAYPAVCYADASGTCTGWSLSLDANGSPVGYLATTAPDPQSQNAPFVQSGGLLLQGLTGTPSAYLWTEARAPGQTDHVYTVDGSVPAGYSAEGITGYLRQSSGSGTVPLTRYRNATATSHYYSTTADQPGGYTSEGTLGSLETAGGAGLLPLVRHHNASTGDYLLTTSTTPPTGYAYQATLGYLRTPTAGPILTTYTRNALGQVTQVTTPTVSYTYTYDPAHRLQTVTDSRGNKELTYTWTAGGRLATLRDGEGSRTDYTYDPVGRLQAVWAPNGETVGFSYDPGGRLTEKWFRNGVSTQYTYTPDNTLKDLVTQKGSTTLSQHTYTYDGVGNRLAHTERIGETTTPYAYAYDPLNRLLQVTGGTPESFTYDPLGNRLTKTSGATTNYYQYDGANQLAQSCADSACTTVNATFTYDLNGNLIQRTDGATAYTYDAENRLAAVTAGSLNETYAYDHQGRRLSKTSGGTTTHYLYNGPDILAEYGTWASPGARYTHGPNVDEPLLRTTLTGPTPLTQFYHQDGLGSVVSVSNQSGSADATARYDAWGTKLAGTGIPQYGYTGREPDETGLTYYRARYYDPTLGRFLQRDPIGLVGGLNSYAYVGGNPVNFADPLGLVATNPLVASQATAAASPMDPPRGMTSGFSNLLAAAAPANVGSMTDAGGGGDVLQLAEGLLLAAAGRLLTPEQIRAMAVELEATASPGVRAVAYVIYGEARKRGVTDEERVAIAWAVRNRVEQTQGQRTYEQIAFQRRQFAPLTQLAGENVTELGAWRRTFDISQQVLSAPAETNPIPGVTHFYSPGRMDPPNSQPDWVTQNPNAVEVQYGSGAFRFYRNVPWSWRRP